MILDDLASSIPDSFEIILLCEAMEDEDAPNFVGEGSNLEKVLIALILTRAIVCPYFCLLQNPSAITMKLALIALNDCFETGVVEDIVVFLAFRNGITKKYQTSQSLMRCLTSSPSLFFTVTKRRE